MINALEGMITTMTRSGDLVRLLGYELKRIARGVRHSASIDITNACNLRCRHCYFYRDPRDIAEEPSLDVWGRRFKDIYAKGVRIVLLLGGEPALRQDVLRLADGIFPFIDVITNGTIPIPPEFKHRIFLSLDGAPETHDAIRGAGVFAEAMKNYAGDSRVVVHMVLGRQNFRDLEKVARSVTENRFRGIVCGLYAAAPGGHDPEMLAGEERTAVLEEICRVRALYPSLLRMSDRMLAWYSRSHDLSSCYWGRDVLHLDVAWRKQPCLGEGDCARCGCLAGAVGSPIRKILHPAEIFRAMS
jgi:MoaA/NifB/PqqE/SkfB family radical SAM enzyme